MSNETPNTYRPSREDPNIRVYGLHRTSNQAAGFRVGTGHPHEIDPNILEQLPALAEDFFSEDLQKFGWEGTLKALLSGTRDRESPLHVLRDYEDTLVREIYSFVANQGARHVKLTIPAALVGQCGDNAFLRFTYGRRGPENWGMRDYIDNFPVTSNGFEDGFVAFSHCGHVEFPPPADRNVNMLPFIFGSKESLPEDLQCYHPLIERCPYMREEIGQVGYLTVHESYVDASKAQRRQGLHIESPGVFQDDKSSFQPAIEHQWGMGVMFGPDRYEGGIYIASSVSNTSMVWDALVDKSCPGIVDRHGGCEYLRPLLGNGTKLQAGDLIWMTDCTPHEALPQETSGYRQFFRVVSPYISHWYADHCTSNPKVDLPDTVKIVRGNKFENM